MTQDSEPLRVDPPVFDYQEPGGRPGWLVSVLEPDVGGPRHRAGRDSYRWAGDLLLYVTFLVTLLVGVLLGYAIR